jgi:hypothetical protein
LFYFFFAGCFYDADDGCVEKQKNCSTFNDKKNKCENTNNGIADGLDTCKIK